MKVLCGRENNVQRFSLERDDSEYMLSRRSYGITESGETYLDFLAESLTEYRQEMDRFFEVYENRPAGIMCRVYE